MLERPLLSGRLSVLVTLVSLYYKRLNKIRNCTFFWKLAAKRESRKRLALEEFSRDILVAIIADSRVERMLEQVFIDLIE